MNDAWNYPAAIVALALPTWLFLRMLRDSVRQTAPLFPPRSETYQQPIAATIAVLLWLVVSVLNKLLADPAAPAELPLFSLQVGFVIQLVIAVFFALLLTDACRWPLRDCGVFLARLDRQIMLGILALLTSIWPTAMLLIIGQLWRTVDTQHAYLQLLAKNSDPVVLAWIAASAVIAAPLAEELLFRVTLQGWLSERLSGPAAIGLTAAVFALVHGWRDALPLLPLSLILGYVFHQTRSYWACVTTHALFNGMFLALAVMGPKEGA